MTQKDQIAKLTETVNMLIKAVGANTASTPVVTTAVPQLDTLKAEITSAFTLLCQLDSYTPKGGTEEVIPPITMSKSVHAVVAENVVCSYSEFKAATAALVDDRELLIDKLNRLLPKALNEARKAFQLRFNTRRILQWRVRHNLPIDDLMAKYNSVRTA